VPSALGQNPVPASAHLLKILDRGWSCRRTPRAGQRNLNILLVLTAQRFVLFNTTFANHVVGGKLGRSSMSLSERFKN